VVQNQFRTAEMKATTWWVVPFKDFGVNAGTSSLMAPPCENLKFLKSTLKFASNYYHSQSEHDNFHSAPVRLFNELRKIPLIPLITGIFL